MCSGTISVGSSTIPSGNSGKRSTISPIATQPTPDRALESGRERGLRGARGRTGRRPRRHQKVVEDRGRKGALEQPVVECLQQHVAAVGVEVPGTRNLARLGGRLER